jgi:hypothetical protein
MPGRRRAVRQGVAEPEGAPLRAPLLDRRQGDVRRVVERAVAREGLQERAADQIHALAVARLGRRRGERHEDVREQISARSVRGEEGSPGEGPAHVSDDGAFHTRRLQPSAPAVPVQQPGARLEEAAAVRRASSQRALLVRVDTGGLGPEIRAAPRLDARP